MVINLSAQEEQLSEIIVSIAEELADNETDPEAVSLYIDRLYELNENPVRLNSADEAELSRLFFLSDFQIKALTDYVHSSGKIFSVFEIVNIPGFDRELTEMIIPFVTLETGTELAPDSSKWRNTLLLNASTRLSEPDTSATGSPWKILSRYKFTAGGFSGGITTEKDSGEKLLGTDLSIPDFLSAHLAWTGTGILRKIVIGDFGARFGMGTNINTGLRTGLSLTASGYLSGGDEIKPYTSTDENNFFRGAAARCQFNRIGLSLFYSVNKIDATTGSTDGISNDYIETFYRSGLHDSPSSIDKKDAVTETSYGLNLTYSFNDLWVGLLWSGSRFSLPVKKTGPDPQDIFDFEGDRNTIASAFYKAIVRRMIFYGEVSSNPDKKLAFVQGLSFRPADRLNINLLYRNYDPGFTSFHGKGAFSSSAGDNVNGIFGNFIFEAAKYLFISAGCDLRYYPWLKYRCSAPSTAKSAEVRVKYLPSIKLIFETSYNYRFAMLDGEVTNGIKKQSEMVSHTIRETVKYSPDEKLSLGIRMEYRIIIPSGSMGMLFLQDINYRFRTVPLSLWFRYCIFNTDDWYSRLYTYENDLLYSFSIPALSGKGNRSYIMAKWGIGKNAELRIKYSITSLLVGNSSDENHEVRMQFRLKF
jgi:hypothetical protein